tara:strand:- start:1030 stop:1248 length:219 start_codon:yes stop_codon:yes gene_type:complete
MSKPQKPRGVKRLLANEILANENVKGDTDLYERHMERKAKLQRRRNHEEDQKLAAIMVDLNVCSGCVNVTVE